MISTPQVRIDALGCARGSGDASLRELACRAVADLSSRHPLPELGGVLAATFSNVERFPPLAVRVASSLGLPPETPAFDLQMACSAYPYAVYLASRLSADTGRPVLVVDGDVQSRLVDPADHATGSIFADCVTACLVSCAVDGRSRWSFLSRADEALTCSEAGPIRMDGMKVFSFVATEVREMLQRFLSACAAAGESFDFFVPHQANPYMIRQLAKALGLADRLVLLDADEKNPGSCSIPLALAARGIRGRALIAGFGAGYSASVGLVEVCSD